MKPMTTIQYMGSKKDLLFFIEKSIEDYIGFGKKINSFYDAFTGSGRVAYYFSDKCDVITSDKQYFSKIILDAYLNSDGLKFSKINQYINELNTLPTSFFEETDKWFTKNYATDYNNGVSVGSDGNPKIWQTKNSKKIDMIRTKIDDVKFLKPGKDDQLKNVLLLSLVLAANKISNVVGHQNGYLKKWSINSNNDLLLENPFENELEMKNKYNNTNYVGDVFDILPKVKADINYFDPPYGTNNENLVVATRYSSFYHLWNTLVKNDRPKIFGKAGKPIETKGWTAPMEKNVKTEVIPEFKRLIELSNSKYVAFSYSNHGLLTKKDFIDLFIDCGCINVKCYEKSHKVNTQSKTAKKSGEYIEKTHNEELIEYFFIAEKPKLSKNEVILAVVNKLNKLEDTEYYSSSFENVLNYLK